MYLIIDSGSGFSEDRTSAHSRNSTVLAQYLNADLENMGDSDRSNLHTK
jgi:hypothetical protein